MHEATLLQTPQQKTKYRINLLAEQAKNGEIKPSTGATDACNILLFMFLRKSEEFINV